MACVPFSFSVGVGGVGRSTLLFVGGASPHPMAHHGLRRRERRTLPRPPCDRAAGRRPAQSTLGQEQDFSTETNLAKLYAYREDVIPPMLKDRRPELYQRLLYAEAEAGAKTP